MGKLTLTLPCATCSVLVTGGVGRCAGCRGTLCIRCARAAEERLHLCAPCEREYVRDVDERADGMAWAMEHRADLIEEHATGDRHALGTGQPSRGKEK